MPQQTPETEAFSILVPQPVDGLPPARPWIAGRTLRAAGAVTAGLATCLIAGCGPGEGSVSSIEYSKDGLTLSVPHRYIGDVVRAGRVCSEVSTADIVAQIAVESSFRGNANSGVAYGISQFEPRTWEHGDHGHSFPGSYWNPHDAIHAQAVYDCELAAKHGSTDAALEAYNSGSPDGAPGYASEIESIASTVHINHRRRRAHQAAPHHYKTAARRHHSGKSNLPPGTVRCTPDSNADIEFECKGFAVQPAPSGNSLTVYSDEGDASRHEVVGRPFKINGQTVTLYVHRGNGGTVGVSVNRS